MGKKIKMAKQGLTFTGPFSAWDKYNFSACMRFTVIYCQGQRLILGTLKRHGKKNVENYVEKTTTFQ